MRVELTSSIARPAISVSLRARCQQPSTELRCAADDGTTVDLWSGPATTGAILEPGSWTVVVDGLDPLATHELRWDVVPDPCLAMTTCDGGSLPTRAVDWSSCACACPDGLTSGAEGCLPSPCAQYPCHGARSRCVASAAAHTCECPLGYVGGPADTCLEDPAAAAWTVIVYESLDNNLGLGGGSAVAEVLPAGAPIHVVWLSATPSDNASIHHEGMGAALEQVGAWDRPDMGDWRTLRDFGTWAAARYPAHHYALVMVNHGGGLDFSWDTGAGGTFISIASGDYARAMAAIVDTIGARLDLVDFAMCLMTRWEVALATRPFARSFLGSPEVAYGMDGSRLPTLLGVAPQLSHVELGRLVVDAFAEGPVLNIQSWVDLDATPAITTRLDALVGEMLARPDLCARYEDVRSHCRLFVLGEVDLGCMALALAEDASMPGPIRAEATALVAAIGAAVYAQPQETSGLGVAIAPLTLPASTPVADRGLDPALLGPGAVWLEASRLDELVLTCRAEGIAR